MEFERRRYNHTHINLTPLVDMVFLLLLFFMLTSQWIQEPAIRVRLPESSTAEVKSDEAKTIFITQNGEIYFMDRRMDIQDLQRAIKEQFRDREKDFLKIKADREANVGLLVSVIDEVRHSGVKNFSIITAKKER
ncbi:MAG: biopolymer transporter ExbD [Thermodesulfobacteriota bacterium]|nr:biopolymer transporter ExbD [Thermodesulfobacteriota bacterium]